MNLVSDLHRSILFYADVSSKPKYQNSVFLQNIVKNLPKLQKIDPNISRFISKELLRDDTDPPKIKAEKLLMSANNLQRYLGY